MLNSAFPECWIGVLSETAESSAYEIKRRESSMRLVFREKADKVLFPTALASVFSKYIRELHMELLNRFWRGRVRGLRPTAGYPADAGRFLDEIAGALGELKVDEDLLLRMR